MKQFFKIFFASLLAMIVMGFIFFGFIIAGIIGLSKSVVDKAEKKTDGNVLVIDLAKTIHEQGATNSFAFLDKSSAYQAGIYDIMKGISAAKTDANIRAY